MRKGTKKFFCNGTGSHSCTGYIDRMWKLWGEQRILHLLVAIMKLWHLEQRSQLRVEMLH